jgi:hypothetical protein
VPDTGEREQIRFLSRELPQILRFPEIERIYWYGWRDFPVGYRSENLPQRGLVTVDHEPKPGLLVLPYVISHSHGWPFDILDTRVEAIRYSWQGARNDKIIAQLRVGTSAVLQVQQGDKGLPWADVVSFPEEMLLAGECCKEERVFPKKGLFYFRVGEDALFITLPAE